MSGNPKFSILERDKEEFCGPVEYVPEAEDILYKIGGTATVKDMLDQSGQVFRIFEDDYTVGFNKVAILYRPEFRKDLIVEGDLVII